MADLGRLRALLALAAVEHPGVALFRDGEWMLYGEDLAVYIERPEGGRFWGPFCAWCDAAGLDQRVMDAAGKDEPWIVRVGIDVPALIARLEHGTL